MDSSDEEFENTPPDLRERASAATAHLLPELSRERYEQAYHKFLIWKQKFKAKSSSENVVLAYLHELSKTIKAPTLWSTYSMLRTVISAKENINISTYSKVKSFLRRQSDGYLPKKSKSLTTQQIQEFIKAAPDDRFLLIKVAMTFGVSGACRRQELYKINLGDLQDLNNAALLVKIPNTKTKVPRSFTLTGTFYDLYRKYAELRPPNVNTQKFFLNYQNGRCTRQVVGINKLGSMPKQIATYLSLPNAEKYTGHAFRRSSATILVDARGDLLTLKRHGGWRSSTVAESYIDDSLHNKMAISDKILHAIEPNKEPTTNGPMISQTNLDDIAKNKPSDADNIITNPAITVTESSLTETVLDVSDLPAGINIQGCSNFTINYYCKPNEIY